MALGAMEARAAELGDAQLAAIAACARANIEQEAANIGTALGPLGTLIGVLNLFTQMIGGPEVPGPDSLSGRSLETIVEPLDAIVGALRTARDAVPLP
jgi:hypothetical protein